MATKKWKIPLLAADQVHGNGTVGLKAGSLVHYKDDYNLRSYVGGSYVMNVNWVEPDYVFEGTLTMDNGIHSGRSAKYVSWTHEDGRNFPMFVAELCKLIKTGAVQRGGIITGKFKVVKRGQNYGIEYIDE